MKITFCLKASCFFKSYPFLPRKTLSQPNGSCCPSTGKKESNNQRIKYRRKTVTGEKRSGSTDLLTQGQRGEEGSSEWEGSGRGKIARICADTHADTDLPKPSEEAPASLSAPVCVACLPASCGAATRQQGSAASHPIRERASPVLNKRVGIYIFTWEGASTIGEHCIACAISSEHATLFISLHKEHDLILHLFHLCSSWRHVHAHRL